MRISRVACSRPTTAGSRTRVRYTAPGSWPAHFGHETAIETNSGVQLGSVNAVTRMSPGSRSESAT